MTNIDVNKLLQKYEAEIGSLKGQVIRAETITEQRIEEIQAQAQEMMQNFLKALNVLQEVSAGLKNTNAQIQLRKKIEDFIAEVTERQPPAEPPMGPLQAVE
jgi:hypothetical protein